MTEEALEDLIARCRRADELLNDLGSIRSVEGSVREADRLHGKAEGVRLVLSYIREAVNR